MTTSRKKLKIIAIVGPNASGKSALAITLAKRFFGEIISADSRQVYKGMDIGSGKVSKREQQSVPHHLIDVCSPKKDYTVSHFILDAHKRIEEITSRNAIPIVCGGTGFWIDALLFHFSLPQVPPNKKLRSRLEKKSEKELFALLKTKDPRRAKNIDQHNKRRLIRALEIFYATKQPIRKLVSRPEYDILWLGVRHPLEAQRQRIQRRLHERLTRGLISEVKKLHANGVTWKRLDHLGLEYRYVARFLTKKISRKEMIVLLEREIFQYAKRQHTWFKRNPAIYWIQSKTDAVNQIKTFTKQKSL